MSSTDENEDKGLERKKIFQFLRPNYVEPKHTVLSSPFAKRLMVAAAGPVKPTWYRAPTFAEFYTFKNLVSLVEEARERPVLLKTLLEFLRRLAPTVTTLEVLRILERLDIGRSNEVDFGEFIFLLANNPFYAVKLKEPKYQNYLLKHLHSPRQRVLYSGLTFYCLIQTEDDIARFYRGKTQQHFDILRYHMSAARNEGLSELEMEEKQKEARILVRKFRKNEHTPYTEPVPFVRATEHEQYYADYLERRKTLPKILRPEKPKKTVHRFIKPRATKRKLGDPVQFENEEDHLVHLFAMGQLPRPDMRVPAAKLKEMRTTITEDEKAYLSILKQKAMKEYYDRLKFAAVAYSKRSLKRQLRKKFPNESSKLLFYSMFRSMMPLSVKEFFVLHPSILRTEGCKPEFRRPAFGKSAR